MAADMSEQLALVGDVADGWEVHPVANIFPMMSEDELADLAADIKANGLLHAIVRTVDGRVLIDGRNRLRACEIAGVVPQFKDIVRDEEEALRLIESANLQRRHMTGAQRAVAYALMHPDPERGKRNDLDTKRLGSKVHTTTLAEAREIIPFDDLAQRVLSGTLPFDKALGDARDRTKAKSDERHHLAELQQEAPDLASLVTDERMTVGEAYAAFKQRIAEAEAAERSKQETLFRMSEALYRGGAAFAVPSFVSEVYDRLGDEKFRLELINRLRLDSQCDDIVSGAKALAKILGEITNA